LILLILFWCRLRDYSALRASPLASLGAAVANAPAFNLACGQVVEPVLFYVGGSIDGHIGAQLLPIIFL
jgi:hypothetical protein